MTDELMRRLRAFRHRCEFCGRFFSVPGQGGLLREWCEACTLKLFENADCVSSGLGGRKHE